MTHLCKCSPPQIQRYISKISGPLLDRIDIHIDVPVVKVSELSAQEATEGWAEIRERVNHTRKLQQGRMSNYRFQNTINAFPIQPPAAAVAGVHRSTNARAIPLGQSENAQATIRSRRVARQRSPGRTNWRYKLKSSRKAARSFGIRIRCSMRTGR